MLIRSSILLMCLTASVWAENGPGVQAVVRACGHPAAPPMSWDHEGQLIGVCVEAARRAFSAVGLTLKVEPPIPWARCQLMVENGEVDVNLCAFANDKRREYAVMVEPPIGHNEAVLIVRRDSSLVYKSWADLKGLRIGMGRGVSFGSDFDNYLAQHARLDIALSEARNLQKLTLGRLDAVITARLAGQQLIRSMGCEGQLRLLPAQVTEGRLLMQMSKHSKHLAVLPQLTAFLKRPAQVEWLQAQHIRFDATYAQLHPAAQTRVCEP
ncbi:substrate-binding periplasmic protein [Roseateles albus]|uniref:Transporter substrate-binding domain-containing protein n=1 Tax=Roseateles albus TaxID=2987525 RepID=A0ABT5K9W8_9BURK|nr:transporter substrate-binding domain-containing protein [Roseateles albus]MDC8770633.1 transporter substrate-binding domain-containing protein [Roseateles albus]